MYYYALIWYLACLAMCLILPRPFHSLNVFMKYGLNKKEALQRIPLDYLVITTWIVIIAPVETKNTLDFFTDIVLKNLALVLASSFTLFIGSLFSGFSRRAGDPFSRLLFRILFVGSLVGCFLLFDVYLPGSIKNCPCAPGYYGDECDGSCWGPNGEICNGNGECGSSGCVCEGNFAGTYCETCINKYIYDSGCTRCESGWSLTFRCTRCNEGRDQAQDCQACLPSYWTDPSGTYNDAESGECTICKPNFFVPSALPSRNSYNDFIQYGGTCTACTPLQGQYTFTESEICQGHGTCQHFWTETDLPETSGGVIELEGTKVLGREASGQCTCTTGYSGPHCDRSPGYDLSTTASICNGQGAPMPKWINTEMYETYDKLLCVCEDTHGPSLSNSDDACSCILNQTGSGCSECVYGYWLDSNKDCNACPGPGPRGGGFLQGCNAARGAGTCDSAGVCHCIVSYDPFGPGGYTGVDCTECANRQFFTDANDPGQCNICPGAISEHRACGGQGICITQIRLAEFTAGTSPETLAQFNTLVNDGTTYTVETLQSHIGECMCYENANPTSDGSCAL